MFHLGIYSYGPYRHAFSTSCPEAATPSIVRMAAAIKSWPEMLKRVEMFVTMGYRRDHVKKAATDINGRIFNASFDWYEKTCMSLIRHLELAAVPSFLSILETTSRVKRLRGTTRDSTRKQTALIAEPMDWSQLAARESWNVTFWPGCFRDQHSCL